MVTREAQLHPHGDRESVPSSEAKPEPSAPTPTLLRHLQEPAVPSPLPFTGLVTSVKCEEPTLWSRWLLRAMSEWDRACPFSLRQMYNPFMPSSSSSSQVDLPVLHDLIQTPPLASTLSYPSHATWLMASQGCFRVRFLSVQGPCLNRVVLSLTIC